MRQKINGFAVSSDWTCIPVEEEYKQKYNICGGNFKYMHY